jgi:dienelactone hydrolase
MPHIVLFHSILGLRPIEQDLAREWEGAGHTVTLPDLFEGRSVEDYDAGFALHDEIGHAVIADRARAAVEDAPDDAILAGVSMGAGLLAYSWGERPASRGTLLIAGAASWAPGLRPGLPVQAHIARPDPFDDEEYFADWAETASGVELDLHRYDGVGHYFLDPSLPDFDETAAQASRAAMLDFLARL